MAPVHEALQLMLVCVGVAESVGGDKIANVIVLVHNKLSATVTV